MGGWFRQARKLHPAALAFVSYGILLVRVRVRAVSAMRLGVGVVSLCAEANSSNALPLALLQFPSASSNGRPACWVFLLLADEHRGELDRNTGPHDKAPMPRVKLSRVRCARAGTWEWGGVDTGAWDMAGLGNTRRPLLPRRGSQN